MDAYSRHIQSRDGKAHGDAVIIIGVNDGAFWLPALDYQAVCGAGNWEIDAAWPHVAAFISSEATDKDILLAAIEAAVLIRPPEASEIIAPLLDSDDQDIVDAVYEALAMTGEFWDEGEGRAGAGLLAVRATPPSVRMVGVAPPPSPRSGPRLAWPHLLGSQPRTACMAPADAGARNRTLLVLFLRGQEDRGSPC